MNRSPLQLALREMHAVITSRYALIGMGLATVLLTVSGPFGTLTSLNISQRFAYWAVTVGGGYLVGMGAATLAIELLRLRITSRWPRAIAGALFAGLPVTAVVLLVDAVAHWHFDAASVPQIWLYCTLVTLVVTLALSAISEVAAKSDAEVSATPPAILERVPLPQRGALIALIVEDHYVDIVTERGKTLVLMRLADAMRETAGTPGLQIHRSHWVATGAVVKAHKSDGKVTLELSNGMRLPVSRGYLPAARGAGLV